MSSFELLGVGIELESLQNGARIAIQDTTRLS
jgi:hypothetical protein